jgi:hypothetical protein
MLCSAKSRGFRGLTYTFVAGVDRVPDPSASKVVYIQRQCPTDLSNNVQTKAVQYLLS